MGRRITRKQLKKDDEFVSAAEVIFQWISDNLRPLLAGIAAVCVVALVWWAISAWSNARTDDASLLLHNATKIFEGDAAPGSPVPGGDIDAAEAAFLQVVDNYARSDQADMARLYLARIGLSRGEMDQASTALFELADRRGDDLVGRLANFDLINLRVTSGQTAEAIADLEAMAAGLSNGLPRDAALYRLGELLIAEGEPDRAKPQFETLVEEFPDSPYVVGARQRLAEIG